MTLAIFRMGGGVTLIVALVLSAAMIERPRERRHAKRPQDVADKLLELASVTADDVVYDLECGSVHAPCR
jgi:uncharacterized phosphosugar-binding protein